MKRIFAGLPVQPLPGLLADYKLLQAELRGQNIRWTRPEHWHFTLWFFGETPEEAIPPLAEALQRVAGTEEFEIVLSGVSVFGSRYKPRVIWTGPENNQKLKALGAATEAVLAPLGYRRDRQNFVPHLTLARLGSPVQRELFAVAIEKSATHFRERLGLRCLNLYESILGSGGAEYNVLYSFPLLRPVP